MGESNFLSTYPFPISVTVTVPGNGGGVAAAQNIYSLLSAGQKALLDSGLTNGLKVMSMQVSPPSAVVYYHATLATPPGPWTVDTANAGGFPIAANQKPNEVIPVTDGDKRIFWLSAAAGSVVMPVVLLCVPNSAIG